MSEQDERFVTLTKLENRIEESLITDLLDENDIGYNVIHEDALEFAQAGTFQEIAEIQVEEKDFPRAQELLKEFRSGQE